MAIGKMIAQISSKDGFSPHLTRAAIDAWRPAPHGIPNSAYSSNTEMFRLVRECACAS